VESLIKSLATLAFSPFRRCLARTAALAKGERLAACYAL